MIEEIEDLNELPDDYCEYHDVWQSEMQRDLNAGTSLISIIRSTGALNGCGVCSSLAHGLKRKEIAKECKPRPVQESKGNDDWEDGLEKTYPSSRNSKKSRKQK